MRQVLETDIEAYFRHFTVAGQNEGMGGFQPAADNPFLRRLVAYLLEITLERGKATPRVIAHAVVEVHRQKDVRITQRIDSVQIICFPMTSASL